MSWTVDLLYFFLLLHNLLQTITQSDDIFVLEIRISIYIIGF
jgi:hypothetical protein